MQGIDNHPLGFAILRMVRLLRAARAKFAATDARIADLEARVTKLGG
jgi:BMFP domain-containing protein YqiC